MIKLPINSKWSQPNTSDKFGSLAYTKNINLDEEGYIKLSPRAINLFDDSGNVTNVSDTDFDYPVAFGRSDVGTFKIATADEPFDLTLSNTAKIIAEDSSSNNPNLAFTSHGVWFQNRWHESTDTAVYYNTAGTWTANAITSLTAGVRHYMAVFKNRNSLLVSNKNVLKQYDTSYSNTTDLTLPSDFEITGVSYNNYKAGIVTRLGSDSAGQNAESFFFTWDGATTTANSGVAIGAYAGVTVFPYKSSWVILTSQGQGLYWNGGGFDELFHLPFYGDEKYWGDLLNHLAYGDNIAVDGDVILINLGLNLSATGKFQTKPLQDSPSGVWCYDPEAGLYHKYSPSLSKVYLHTVSSISASTDTFTTTATIPSTGNPIIMTQGCTDLVIGKTYYIIKVTSTTFKLATTRQNALDAQAVDITDTTTSYFFAYDIIDYGISHYTNAGAIGLWGTSNLIFRDILFGSNLFDTTLTGVKVLNTTVPLIENRGYFVTPKVYLDNVTEKTPNLFIKHRVLKENDAIIVKYKGKDLEGLPISTPGQGVSTGITWTSSTTGTVTNNLSDAKTAFDNGEELELELISGLGAGQNIKITNITESSGTYTITVEDAVVGYSAGLKSYFTIDNWKFLASVDSTTQKEGIFEVPVAKNSRAPQFKIELRGYETCVEDILIINQSHQK